MPYKKCTLIIGSTSGIGRALTKHLEAVGERVVGTTRCDSRLGEDNDQIFSLDVSSKDSIKNFVKYFARLYTWERLIFCPAVMAPIGPFSEIDIEEWMSTFSINFSNQIYLLRKLLPKRRGKIPRVIFFAGGGTNSAPRNYSAYTVSKIALIKMVELLDEEMDDMCFTIIGPGWVKTKIHEQSLAPGLESLESFGETKRRLQEDDFVPMERVVQSIMWVLSGDKEIVGGRNFSTAHDPFDSDDFIRIVSSDRNALKLRRHSNDFTKRRNSQ